MNRIESNHVDEKPSINETIIEQQQSSTTSDCVDTPSSLVSLGLLGEP